MVRPATRYEFSGCDLVQHFEIRNSKISKFAPLAQLAEQVTLNHGLARVFIAGYRISYQFPTMGKDGAAIVLVSPRLQILVNQSPAGDLKSVLAKARYGFESHHRHALNPRFSQGNSLGFTISTFAHGHARKRTKNPFIRQVFVK